MSFRTSIQTSTSWQAVCDSCGQVGPLAATQVASQIAAKAAGFVFYSAPVGTPNANLTICLGPECITAQKSPL